MTCPLVLSIALTVTGNGQAKFLFRVVVAETDGILILFDQVFLLRKGFFEQDADDVEIDIQQCCDDADIGDILHQDSFAGTFEVLVAQTRQGHAEHRDVVPGQQAAARPGRVVHQPAATRDFCKVLRIGLRVHRHHDVDAIGPRLETLARDPDLVPGRQALDVRREVILADDRDSHPKDGFQQQPVGTGRAGTVDRSDFDYDIVDSGHEHLTSAETCSRCCNNTRTEYPNPIPVLAYAAETFCRRGAGSGSLQAYGTRTVDFCMSQAPVGQRSAHRLQCTHRSSSLTITRLVCGSASDT